MRMNYKRKTHNSFQKILYKFGEEVLFHKFFSLFSPFDKHFPCFPSSFVYAKVQPKILSLFSMYLFPTLQVTVFSSSMKNSPIEIPTFLISYYIFPISHLALVQVNFYFYLYFKNKTHKDSKDVYNFTYSQYLEKGLVI